MCDAAGCLAETSKASCIRAGVARRAGMISVGSTKVWDEAKKRLDIERASELVIAEGIKGFAVDHGGQSRKQPQLQLEEAG